MADPGLGRYDPRELLDTNMSDTGTGTCSPIQWEDRVRTLKEIVQSGKIPCLVKVNRTDVSKYSPEIGHVQNNGLPEDEILHVLELRRHKIVIAHKLQWDRRTGDYQETGKQMEINVTQKGNYSNVICTKDLFHFQLYQMDFFSRGKFCGVGLLYPLPSLPFFKTFELQSLSVERERERERERETERCVRTNTTGRDRR